MLAGASPGYWIGFHLLVIALLLIDLVVLQRRSSAPSLKMAWGWTAVVAALAGCFALMIWHNMGRRPALEFTSGYLIEGSLSVDNLFVFLLMFRALCLSREEQRRALFWGVLGAIVMRALFIVMGVSLLTRFEWVQYIFGAGLLIAAVRLMRPSHAKTRPSRLVRWLHARRSPAVAAEEQTTGHLNISSLLLVIVAIEVTDLIFALDSIPAVLAITRNPFLAYTSNIFAILGLRSLFFALSHLLDKLRLLHYGLAIILAFVACKMLLAKWILIPVGWSLAAVVSVLAAFTAASIFSGRPPADPHHTP